MASSSNSEFKCSYDIFLSFRGLDTRNKFNDHLYKAFKREGFQTFRDNEGIERGENINSELQKAIWNSSMSVIVLSKNYATSESCLFEIQTILEHHKKKPDHIIFPVFYEVDPGEIEEQAKKLDFGEEKATVQEVEGWSAALKEVASMAGMVSGNQSNGSEAKFIEEIIGVLKSKQADKHRLRVIMPNNFPEDKIKKVMSGTLRLQTEFVHKGILVTCKGGAGILLNRKGYLLTNAHVVSHNVLEEGRMALGPHWLYGNVLANFDHGEQCEAVVISVDFGNDLALLKIPERVIKHSNSPCVFTKVLPARGDDFFVVGHPKGPSFNVKYGHVSDPSRHPSDIPQNILNDFPHFLEHMDADMKFLELDVGAAPGFSGGPLSTVDGSVFGILHAGIDKTIYGIPFAIIERSGRRMFYPSNPGYDVFCHLN